MRPITPQTPTITLELAGEIVTRYRREAAKEEHANGLPHPERAGPGGA
jgi:hypothetical protein